MYEIDNQDMTLTLKVEDKIKELYTRGVRVRKGGLQLALDSKESIVIKVFWATMNENISVLTLKYLNDLDIDLVGETEYLQQFVKDYKEFLEELDNVQN